jgi:hypothetical protein
MCIKRSPLSIYLQCIYIHGNEQVSIFTDADIDNVFGIFDITNRGYLDPTQLEKGMI